MNRGIPTLVLLISFLSTLLHAGNPSGDLRIRMLDYYNLVVDHNIQTPNGASPRAVYIGVKICNDGTNDLTDAFAYIGNYAAQTPGVYPSTTASGVPYAGSFSFTHEGGTADATRYIGNLAAGTCVTQYWLLSYPLLDANGNRVTGSKPDQTDDLRLRYDVWASANDDGMFLEANDSKTVQCRAMISASANKIWPNTTSKVPNELLAAFPEKQLGWRRTTNTTHPGASVVLEGIWFDLGNIGQGFDNDGDFVPDGNFLLQPVGNPGLFDANCFRLVKVWGLVALKGGGQSVTYIEFEDQMHFANNSPSYNGGVGMIFYEFAILNGPCSSTLSPYQQVASGMNEKHNGDFGKPGGTLVSDRPSATFDKTAPAWAERGNQIQYALSLSNTSNVPLGVPQRGAHLVFQDAIPANTAYVGGTAAAGNTLPAGTNVKILYSTDNGVTWERNEPVPASSVTNIQWWLNKPLAAGTSATMTFDVVIAANYPDPVLFNTGGVSLGNSAPFLTDETATLIKGAFTIEGNVFSDNGNGGGTAADGIKNGTEAGLPNVDVRLYVDRDGNAQVGPVDILISEQTSDNNGAVQFTELSDGNYIVTVDYDDGDIPDRWTNTSAVAVRKNDLGVSNPTVFFGFSPLLLVQNTLAGASPVYENDVVSYRVDLTNLGYAQGTSNNAVVTAWASALDGATTFEVNPANMLGAPDGLYTTSNLEFQRKAVVKGFNFGTQTANIVKVELLFKVYIESDVKNDKMFATLTLGNGSTVTLPNPKWGKNTSPSLNDYIGQSNAGMLTLDVTSLQTWNWGTFDNNWKLTLEGQVQGQDDGPRIYIDAIGVRITKDCCSEGGGTGGEPSDPHTTISLLPVTYQFDAVKMAFISSSVVPDSTSEGILYWQNMGPLYPAQTKPFNLNFRALQPEVSPCALTAPECTSVPNPYTQCIAPASGYFADVTTSGNTTWSVLLPGVNAASMDKKVRITGSGTVTISNGDLKLLNSNSLLVVEGVTLVVNNGNFILESASIAIFENATLRTYGNIELKSNAYLCMTGCTLECGDELAGGLFNTGGSSTSANFSNDGGRRYLENVCMNVTHDFSLSSASSSEDILINVCGEIGDQGASHAASGTLDGSDSGNFSITKSCKIFKSEITVVGNIQTQSGGTLQACDVNFRTLNGTFSNAGTFKGCEVVIWVPDGFSIECSSTWTANVEKRRGSSTLGTQYLPVNSPLAEISPIFNNCSCNVTNSVEGLIQTDAIVTDAISADGLPVNQSNDQELVGILDRGSVSGFIFSDKNVNGWQGTYGYETGTDFFMEGVIVNLYGCTSGGQLMYPAPNINRKCTHGNNGGTWTLLATDTTDLSGSYAFKGLKNGYYYVSVNTASMPGSVSQKADPDKTNGLCTTCDNLWKDLNANLSQVAIIGSANDFIHINFGYGVSPSMGGYVFEDKNGDGTKGSLETYLAGVIVERVSGGCTFGVNCPTTTTDANGRFNFPSLTAGTAYTLKIRTSSLPSGGSWSFTAESDGTTDNAITQTLTAGQQSMSDFFGVFKSGSSDLSGVVYYDWQNNGMRNSSDEGIAYVAMKLFKDLNNNGSVDNGIDPLMQTTQTDDSGNYTFPNNAAGNYIIVVDDGTLPIPPMQTCDPDEEGICTFCDGQGRINGVDGSTDRTDLNFGYGILSFNRPSSFTTYNIAGGTIFSDQDGNGLKSSLEPALENITVELWGDLNFDDVYTLVSSKASGAAGAYFFEGIPDGKFMIIVDEQDEDLPVSSAASTAVMHEFTVSGGSITMLNGATCSNCDTRSLDFGFAPMGIIESFVFYDNNGDGQQDWSEEGIPGVTLYLCQTGGNPCNAVNALATVVSSATAPEGFFHFHNLMPGNYTVAVDVSTLPAGIDATSLTADPNTDGIPCYYPLNPADPNFALLSGGCDNKADNIGISFGSSFAGANFGYRPAGVIGERVWFDSNGNGVKDANENGMQGVQLNVSNATTVSVGGSTYNPGQFTRSTFTDFDGKYAFNNLPDATWTVAIVPPANHVTTFEADGSLNGSVTVVMGGGKITNTGNAWCPSGNDCSLWVNFGLRPNYNGALSGTVCLDPDQDGRCNTGGETFPPGVSVYLYDQRSLLFGQTTVDNAGFYQFTNLPNDTFTVAVGKSTPPLQLTTMTTSFGDTPAFFLLDDGDNAFQKVKLTGTVAGMDFGFAFTDTLDLGDLPAPYMTELSFSSVGPAHILPSTPTLYLGNKVDAEFFPTLHANASGDDSTGVDDEDGILFGNPSNWEVGSVAVGKGGSLTAAVTGSGWLLGWADFNEDGDFNDAGEMLVNRAVSTGSFNVTFDIPTGTELSGGQMFYVRFRLFQEQPLSPATSFAGIANNGEVEDYVISICKNLTNPGTIAGIEAGCNGFDPTAITESTAPEGGGGTLEYQWQRSTDGGLTWTDIAGANSQTYDPGAISQSTHYRRGARRGACTDFSWSNAIPKTILSNFTDPGAIVGNEDNCGIFDPDIILSVIAPSGGTGNGTPEYQWQRSIDNITWTDIPNTNDEFYNPGVIAQTTWFRRGARKSPCQTFLYSNVITKTVAVNYTNAGSVSGDENYCGSYDPANILSLSPPSGGTDGYQQFQWELSTNNGTSWTNISGATASTYNPPPITVTTLYRRKARRSPCSVWVNSNVVTKQVRPYPTANIAEMPSSPSGYLCELTEYQFRASDAGANVTYAWNFGPYATPATASGMGPHTVQFDVPGNNPLTSTTVSLAVTMNGCVSNTSANLTFRPEIFFNNVILDNPSQCKSNNGSITINATFPGGASIQYSIDGGASWASSNYFNQLGAGTYDIRARYVGGDCQKTYGIVALSDPPPQATLLVSSSQPCVGDIVTFQAIPDGSNPTFAWAFGNNAVPNTASGAGPHSVVFNNGGPATVAVTMVLGDCVGVRDTTIQVVKNFTSGGSVIGGETLCGLFNPAPIEAGANPSGGNGGSILYQWEQRQSDGAGGWNAWQDIAGATDAAYDPGVISTTTEYRRKARRNPCSAWVTSNSVVARLVPKPNLGDDNYFTVCPGYPHADNVSDNDFNLVNPVFSMLVIPTNGTIDFEADGEFIYVPNSTFCGTDEFRYTVCNDSTGCCDTARVVIDLTDSQPPGIANVPPNITISCDDQIPVAQAVDVVENCQNVSLGMDEFSTKGTDSCAFHNYQLVRIWTGVDYCTNSASDQQVITVQDRTAPDIFRIYRLPNGKRMVAGVMENVSQNWKTVRLPVTFTTPPVVFAQVITKRDNAAVIARMRNVSTTQFQMRLQEEEGNDGTHPVEDVAWVAIEKGAFTNPSAPFEVGSWLLTSIPNNQPFLQNYPSAPHFIGTMMTNNEGDPATLRFDNLTGSSVDTWLQEETSFDGETTHNLETVGFLVFQNTGNITDNNGEVIGEIGRISITESLTTINLLHKYHNPVVVLGGISNNDAAPVTIRVKDLTPASFKVQLQNWDYSGGPHAAESLSYFVVEGSLPLDRTVPCNAIPPALSIGTQIVAIDNCDNTIELLMAEDAEDFDCQTDTIFTRTWSSIDDCGNLTQMTQTYRLIDTLAPTFTVPPTVTILCSDNKDDLNLTGRATYEADNCTQSLTAVYTDNLVNLAGCTGYIIRIWTLTDNCGNSTVKLQLIYVAPEEDSDHDGVPDYFDLDDDNDGIPDVVETENDFDGDGIVNRLDLDSNNDGIPDLIEAGGVDVDGDGRIDVVGSPGWDHDGDGFSYGYDANDIDTSLVASNNFNPTSATNDRDGDGIPNFLDRDSDNDGIPDLVEAGGIDTDGNGIIDYPVVNDPTSMVDADRDGFSDRYDPDDDGLPGAEDTSDPLIVFNGQDYNGGISSYQVDFDGDDVPDFFDIDSDNDGIPDLIEAGGVDFNGDGRIELTGFFVDLNNDGFDDKYASLPVVSTDADGIPVDGRPSDTNGDGKPYKSGDFDFDGQPNHRDSDSDNDRITDIFEIGLFVRDNNFDGVIDNWTDLNKNGMDDVAEVAGVVKTEYDGFTADGRPEDSEDADFSAYRSSQSDGLFAQTNGNPDIDDDGDGALNFLDSDSDNDYLPDMLEDKNFSGRQDDDETSLYNPDSDADGIFDGIEDFNRNGQRDSAETDPLDANTDGDPLDDGQEDTNFNGILDDGETDPRNPCDPFLSLACKGLALDVKVKLSGALADSDTPGLMKDNLRMKFVMPVKEPYTNMTHLHHIGDHSNDANGNGQNANNGDFKEVITPGILYTTGENAPVDWVLVELRAANKPDSIVATRAAILQRDGDVRDLDGLGYVIFREIPSGYFYVSVRHRNHLGVMTADPYLLSPTVTTIDFADPETPVFGNNAMVNFGDQRALWPGDFNGDGKIIYQGPGNDVLQLFQRVVVNENNTGTLANFVLDGYLQTDINLDGNGIYQGPNNDRAKLLILSILATPDNVNQLANFIVLQKLP